jgi:hypothetical protein
MYSRGCTAGYRTTVQASLCCTQIESPACLRQLPSMPTAYALYARAPSLAVHQYSRTGVDRRIMKPNLPIQLTHPSVQTSSPGCRAAVGGRYAAALTRHVTATHWPTALMRGNIQLSFQPAPFDLRPARSPVIDPCGQSRCTIDSTKAPTTASKKR